MPAGETSGRFRGGVLGCRWRRFGGRVLVCRWMKATKRFDCSWSNAGSTDGGLKQPSIITGTARGCINHRACMRGCTLKEYWYVHFHLPILRTHLVQSTLRVQVSLPLPMRPPAGPQNDTRRRHLSISIVLGVKRQMGQWEMNSYLPVHLTCF